MKLYTLLFLLLSCASMTPLPCLEDNFDFGTFSTEPELTLATRCKWRIFSQKGSELTEGIELLQPLIREACFKKLPPDTQAKIVLLLLEGYERTHQLQEAVLLLRQQLKRSELWKSHTILKAALAKVLYLQEDFKEADPLLKPLCIANSPSYTSFEKKKISKAILVREEKIFNHLEKAKELLAADLFIEASLHLEKIVPSLLEEFMPFQDSPLSRKRLTLTALFALAECYTVWDKEKAISLLTTIEKEYAYLLSHVQKIKLEALQKISKEVFPKAEIEEISQCTPSLEQKILLWQAQYALSNLSKESSLISLLAEIKNNLKYPSSIQHYIYGVQELLDGHPHIAYDLLKETVSESSLEKPSFKKQYLEAYQEALWMRSLFCFFTEKNDVLDSLLKEGVLLQEGNSRKSCLYALQCIYEGRPIVAALVIPNHLVSVHLKSILTGEKIPCSSIATLSFIDQLFLNMVALYIKQSQPFDIKSVTNNSDMGLVLQAMYQPQPEKSLQELLSNQFLDDAHPKILHLLLTQDMQRRVPKCELEATMQQFLFISSGYGKRRQALLEYFFFIDHHPEFSYEEKKKVLEELTKAPYDSAAMLAILYLQKNSSLTAYSFPKELDPFVHIITIINSARLLQKEADKTIEMGQKTDIIRLALKKFKEAEATMRDFLTLPQHPDEKVLAFGVYIQLLSQWTELLFNETLSDHPFLELEERLSETSGILNTAQELMTTDLLSRNINVVPRTLCEVQELKSALDLLLCTFKGEYEEALFRCKALSPASLLLSRSSIKSVLYLVQSLRKRDTIEKGWPILITLHEKEIKDTNQELALEIAIEKSLYLRDKKLFSQAMTTLAWVINDSAASSLRIKAMVLRAEIYKQLKRPELAIRQLEAAKGKGGEWGQIAERKLKELYGTGDDTFSLYDNR